MKLTDSEFKKQKKNIAVNEAALGSLFCAFALMRAVPLTLALEL
ncbi:hypothetical protein [Paenibacillus ferrarius]|nr:hypothetical protein [Paenibacillus ferrarius]